MFGLALTSMCINVIQLKLSDSFRQASKKIGTSIGLIQMAEAASQNSQSHQSTPQSALAQSAIDNTVTTNSVSTEISPKTTVIINGA